MEDREMVLSYKDVVLRVSDLNRLKGPYSLNDQIIDFYFAYLSSHYNADTNGFLLVSPSTSYWFANCQDQQSLRQDFAEPLRFSTKKLIFFTVNDNEDFSAVESGSHWSLLVYDRTWNGFFHFDSLSGMHRYQALKLYDAVKGFMDSAVATESSLPSLTDGTGTKNENNAAAAVMPFFKEAKTPRQHNGYDCGLYVMAIAEAICGWHCEMNGKDDGDWPSAVENTFNASLETTMRSKVLKLIEDLRKQ